MSGINTILANDITLNALRDPNSPLNRYGPGASGSSGGAGVNLPGLNQEWQTQLADRGVDPSLISDDWRVNAGSQELLNSNDLLRSLFSMAGYGVLGASALGGNSLTDLFGGGGNAVSNLGSVGFETGAGYDFGMTGMEGSGGNMFDGLFDGFGDMVSNAFGDTGFSPDMGFEQGVFPEMGVETIPRLTITGSNPTGFSPDMGFEQGMFPTGSGGGFAPDPGFESYGGTPVSSGGGFSPDPGFEQGSFPRNVGKSILEQAMKSMTNQRSGTGTNELADLLRGVLSNVYSAGNQRSMEGAYNQARDRINANQFPFKDFQQQAYDFTDPNKRYQMMLDNPGYQASRDYATKAQMRRNARTGDLGTGYGDSILADVIGKNARDWDSQNFGQIEKMSGMGFNNANSQALLAQMIPQMYQGRQQVGTDIGNTLGNSLPTILGWVGSLFEGS